MSKPTSENKLQYYYRTQTQAVLEYGERTIKISETRQLENITETFEYCYDTHEQSSTSGTSMEMSVSGAIKMFDVGGSASASYSETTTKKRQTGDSVKEIVKESTTTLTEFTITIPMSHVLVEYVVVDVLCYTVNGGPVQYEHVPSSETISRTMNHDQLKTLAQSGAILMDKVSWAAVASEYNDIQPYLEDIEVEQQKLKPFNKVVSDKFKYGDKICLINQYDASKGYLETNGISPYKDGFCVQTHSNPDRDVLSGVWEISPIVASGSLIGDWVFVGDVVKLINQYCPKKGYLDTRGYNKYDDLNVLTTNKKDRDVGSSNFTIISKATTTSLALDDGDYVPYNALVYLTNVYNGYYLDTRNLESGGYGVSTTPKADRDTNSGTWKLVKR